MALVMLLPGEPVRAQAEGTWCLKYSSGPGSSGNAAVSDRSKPAANERTLWGSTAFCTQNPGYLPYWQGRFGEEPRRKVSRKKKHRRH